MTDVHSLSGAYALDAVDDLERAAFERHLRECDTCSVEVLELRETVARLSDSVAVEPPPALRDSVLQAVARTPQAPPGRSTAQRSAAASAKRWRRFAAASVAAGVIAVGVGVGTWTVANRNVDDANRATAVAEARVEQFERVLAAPDALLFKGTGRDGGTVNVTVSRSLDSAVAGLEGLPDPGEGRIYQLWMIPAGDPATVARSVGQVPSAAAPTAHLVTAVGDATTFGVTIEPEGGSPRPTLSNLVAQVALT
jgi:anti-sigma-K factor RskA